MDRAPYKTAKEEGEGGHSFNLAVFSPHSTASDLIP